MGGWLGVFRLPQRRGREVRKAAGRGVGTAPRNALGSPADRQRRPAPRVAVQLGEHAAGDAPEPQRERLGHPRRLLPGHRIHHEKDLRGGHGAPHSLQLLHQRVVRLGTARRVDDHCGEGGEGRRA